MSEISQEPNLQHYVRIVVKRKWLVGFVFLGAVIVAGIRTLLLPSLYEAKATLIVMPPRYKPDLQPRVLLVESYKRMLEGDNLKQRIIETLNLDERGISLTSLREMLTVNTRKQETGSKNAVAYSPLIDLRVVAGKPSLAAEIADAWARSFLEENRQLTSRETKYNQAFIQKKMEETKVRLDQVEGRLIVLESESRLPAMRKELDGKRSALYDRLDRLTVVELDLQQKKQELQRNRMLLSAIRPEDKLLGTVVIGQYQPEKPLEFEELTGMADELRTNALMAVSRLEDAQKLRDDAILDLHLTSKKNKYEGMVKLLSSYENELTRISYEEKEATITVRELKKQIDLQQPVINLKKSIVKDDQWDTLRVTLNESQQRILSDLKVFIEEVNPMYFNLVEQLISFEVKKESYEGKRQALEKRIDQLTAEATALLKDIWELERQQQIVEQTLDSAQKDFQYYLDFYRKKMIDVSTLEVSVSNLQSEQYTLKKEIEQLEEETSKAQSFISAKTNEIAVLEDLRSALKKTYSSFASKAEEARIAETEEVADIRIVAGAVVPEQPIGTVKVTLLGVAGFLGLFGGAVLAILLEFFEENTR